MHSLKLLHLNCLAEGVIRYILLTVSCCDSIEASKQPVACVYPDRFCRTDNTTCVKVFNLCNGRQDCADGSDEDGMCGKNALTEALLLALCGRIVCLCGLFVC